LLRFLAIGLALLAVEAQAQDDTTNGKTANAIDIRQLQCDAVSASSAPPLVTSDNSSESKDFQAAILSDTTINGPARANAAAAGTSANDDSASSTLSTGQTPSSGTGGVSRDQSRPAGPIAGRCGRNLNVDDGDKSKDVKILQVSPQSAIR